MNVPPSYLLVAALGYVCLVALTYLVFRLRFEYYKRDYTKGERKDAVQRSQAVTLGKVYEHVAPYLPDFRWNPKDARFVGTPVDFLVFDGLSEGELRAVVFVEVKTGSSGMNARERQVRDAILDQRVEWETLSMPDVRIQPDSE